MHTPVCIKSSSFELTYYIRTRKAHKIDILILIHVHGLE